MLGLACCTTYRNVANDLTLVALERAQNGCKILRIIRLSRARFAFPNKFGCLLYKSKLCEVQTRMCRVRLTIWFRPKMAKPLLMTRLKVQRTFDHRFSTKNYSAVCWKFRRRLVCYPNITKLTLTNHSRTEIS